MLRSFTSNISSFYFIVLPQQQESSEIPSSWLRVCGSHASVSADFQNSTYPERNVWCRPSRGGSHFELGRKGHYKLHQNNRLQINCFSHLSYGFWILQGCCRVFTQCHWINFFMLVLIKKIEKNLLIAENVDLRWVNFLVHIPRQ